MKKVFCDRCDKELKEVPKLQYDVNGEYRDLCDECRKKFLIMSKNWLEELRNL